MFLKEIKYCAIGVPICILFLILHPGSGVVVGLLLWMLCRDYHVKQLKAILKYGPCRVIGPTYREHWDYAVYCDWLRKQIAQSNQNVTKTDNNSSQTDEK